MSPQNLWAYLILYAALFIQFYFLTIPDGKQHQLAYLSICTDRK